MNIPRYIRNPGANSCSSINEVKLALMRVSFFTNTVYIKRDRLRRNQGSKELGVISISTVYQLEKFGAVFGQWYPVGIRLRPNIFAGGNMKISTGHDKSKFGIPSTR